jgi:hypothetical protein
LGAEAIAVSDFVPSAAFGRREWSTARASLLVRLYSNRGQAAPDIVNWPKWIDGLLVEPEGVRYTALPKPGGLYGFLGLPPGNHRMRVTDPLDRHLPALFTVSVDEVRRADLNASVSYAELPLLPGIGMPEFPGETIAWGVALDAAGKPLPLARIETTVHIDSPAAAATLVTRADDNGVYLAWFGGERAPLGVIDPTDPVPAVDRTFTVYPFIGPRDPNDPIASLPVDFHALKPGDPDFTRYYAATPFAVPGAVRAGRRQRLDLRQAP